MKNGIGKGKAALIVFGCILFCALIMVIVIFFVCPKGKDIMFYREHKWIYKEYESKEEHWDPEASQDSVDYCKYVYDEKADDWFTEKNGFYELEYQEVADAVIGYFDSFKGWMEAGDRMDEYDFDDLCITAGDYCYVASKEGNRIGPSGSTYDKYDDYSVYFYDVETHTLYYIHANI